MSGLPKVLIVSVPKSGTNLLMQVILGIPGMVQTRANMLARINAHPIAPGEMGVMHLPYSNEVEEELLAHNVKIIFISRDLRDIAVSMMHFIETSFPTHVLYPAFTNYLGSDERLSVIINGLDFNRDLPDTVWANELYVANGYGRYPNIQEFWSPFAPWMNRNSVCHVTFEELSQPSAKRTEAIKRILNFLWTDLSQLGIPKGMLATQMGHNINPAQSSTYRAGRIGDWTPEFNAKHKDDFKKVAGQTLIDLAYEKDLSW